MTSLEEWFEQTPPTQSERNVKDLNIKKKKQHINILPKSRYVVEHRDIVWAQKMSKWLQENHEL